MLDLQRVEPIKSRNPENHQKPNEISHFTLIIINIERKKKTEIPPSSLLLLKLQRQQHGQVKSTSHFAWISRSLEVTKQSFVSYKFFGYCTFMCSLFFFLFLVSVFLLL